MTYSFRRCVLVAVILAVSACSATVRTGTPEPEPGEFVWVCHGNRNPTWQRVGAPAADAHRRHGDRVTSEPQESGASCSNS